ncbi:PIG-L family deacetylase [Mucilaginibacter pedocola]|uniref:GlcNAc-PI de-N-acetylase n=1 Tax=Mucilaginibacter pedocola TaxID=1792845 RepID=A0A1S9PA25_9SPHI|nr:PIG-L family deacetylase [Mucilaginibacter pedocola]OOQ57779.1 hypothetical protein BC343_13410 [Mucilaginibacter pedocola]
MRTSLKFLLLFLVLKHISINAVAQEAAKPPRVLVVMAHPDDESTFSVTLYKIAKEQHGTVDLFVITNGEAGFKYATLAEAFYGRDLTDEQTGRQNLPRIRKQELMNAGKILGVSEYHFAGQQDSKFTLNERQPLDSCWNVTLVGKELKKVLLSKSYDFVFCLLPEADTHGAHKAAALLSLDIVHSLPEGRRPTLLGATLKNKTGQTLAYTSLRNYPETEATTDTAAFVIDRTASFSYHNRVNYKVIANWEIAEHKTQGVTQMTMNEGDLEEFWFFKQNDAGRFEKCRQLFDKLKLTPYLAKTY